MESNRELWNKIYDKFNSQICTNCRWYNETLNKRVMSRPQPIPYIGCAYEKDKYRLMFAGMESYSNEGSKGLYSIFPVKRAKELYLGNNDNDSFSHFWEWVRQISSEVLKLPLEEAFNHIAYSNLIKCQARETLEDFDNPTRIPYDSISINCIQRSRWIHKEIEEIDPYNVIVFTGVADQYFLSELFLNDPYHILIDLSLKYRENNKFLIYLNDGKRNYFITRYPKGSFNSLRKEIIEIIKGERKKKPLIWKLS